MYIVTLWASINVSSVFYTIQPENISLGFSNNLTYKNPETFCEHVTQNLQKPHKFITDHFELFIAAGMVGYTILSLEVDQRLMFKSTKLIWS